MVKGGVNLEAHYKKTIIGMRLPAKLSQANNVVTAGRIILNDENAYETWVIYSQTR